MTCPMLRGIKYTFKIKKLSGIKDLAITIII